ncbi:PPC domain-containing DNA-binding protein [Bosea sp. TWI1241]|uniref:PPC domain-containing DNA-binding protein n=1 Tax=Bosea sp. TWI1241 TaxID=3148904 RepID=UPI0032085264
MTEPKRFIATPTGYFMVLRRGDDVFARLEALMREEDIAFATFSGFGFLSRAIFGFYDYVAKAFRPKTFEQLELTNMTGTLAWKEGAPSIHAHGVAGDESFRAYGGHLLALEVGRGSVEIAITTLPIRLERAVDPDIGANVLQLGS